MERNCNLKEGDLNLEYRKIGAKVLYYRKQKRWTQKKLAEITGLSCYKISKIECGKDNYTLATMLTLAKAFNVDYERLMS